MMFGSDDAINTLLNFSPRNRNTPTRSYCNSAGITPSKINNMQVPGVRSEQSSNAGVAAPSLGFTSSSDKCSSRYYNPFNDTNSLQPRYTHTSNNEGIKISTPQKLTYLLPPIVFQDEIYDRTSEALRTFFLERSTQNPLFDRGANYTLKVAAKAGKAKDREKILSSPICHGEEIVIDKDFLTSEPENYDSYLHPWLLKQDNDFYLVSANGESEALKPPTKRNKLLLDEELQKPIENWTDVPSFTFEGVEDARLSSSKKKPTKYDITVKGTCAGNRHSKHGAPHPQGKKIATSNGINEEESPLNNKSVKRDVESSSIMSTVAESLSDESHTGERESSPDDDEYFPTRKITRSKSKKSKKGIRAFLHPLEKKRKLGPRSKNGCWTCRVRHKACPEEKPRCSQCVRLNLKCDYSTTRPKYMTDPVVQASKLKEIKNITFKQKRNNFTKRARMS